MCGVVGYIDICGKPIDREIFCQMTDLLAQRWPDDRGICTGSAGIGQKGFVE